MDPTGSEGVKPAGIGGAIRRLLQQHCSSCKWFKKGGDDLFARKHGFWTVKEGSATAQLHAAERQAAA